MPKKKENSIWTLALRNYGEYERWLSDCRRDGKIPRHTWLKDTETGQIFVRF